MSVDVVVSMWVVHVGSSEVELVRQLSFTAREKIGTRTNHFGGKCKLLAVENKGVFVVVNFHLTVVSGFLQMFDSVQSFTKVSLLCYHVLVDVVLVVSNATSLLVDPIVNLSDVVAQVHD